jgi:DNA-binding NtrC family response regulator
MIHILFIDDDPNAHDTLKMILGSKYKINSAYTGYQGKERITQLEPDLIILDISLPDIDGISLLKQINIKQPVIMLTAHNEINLVVEAVKSGASDFITKPYTLETLENAIRNSFLDKNYSTKSFDTESYPGLQKIIGESPFIKQTKELVVLFGTKREPVLIQGESGTGKELIAEALHEVSGIKKELVSINCSSVPVQLFESEFFGSAKGAFTDAVEREGILKQADKNTLFLDEIGDMPLQAQAKLLRVLEDKKVKKLGTNHYIPADFRLVSATHKNLKTMIDEGSFRHDLYYRINVLEIFIPPLRERKDDIPILAAYFLKNNDSEKKTIRQDALDKLKSYSWPGNIRELASILKRAVIYSGDRDIEAKDIILH